MATLNLTVRSIQGLKPGRTRYEVFDAQTPGLAVRVRATTPARRGARQPPVSRSATCAAWRSIRDNRTSSWYQRRLDRTPRTWLADRMAGCIADSLTSAGSASATVGQSHRAQSRRCSAPAPNLERCGPPMSAACTVRTIAEKAGAVSPATRRRRSISAVWPCCSNADQTRRPRRGSLPQRKARRPTARSTTS